MYNEYQIINSDYMMRILQKMKNAEFEQITTEELIEAYENYFNEMKILQARVSSLKEMSNVMNKIILMKISHGDKLKQLEWMKLRELIL